MIENSDNTLVSDISIVSQVNGVDLHSKKSYNYYNKIYPLETEDIYDDETNNLLKSMVRTKMKNIMFLPYKMIKNGSLLDTDFFDNITFNFYGLNTNSSKRTNRISIYIKLANENSEKIDKINYFNI